jgi:dienelactone hydrolase
MTPFSLLLTTCLLGQPDPVFDHKAILAQPLNARILKTTEKAGTVTEEIMFHSETDGKKSVDIFAFFSYPKDARKLPAFIWNQGGLAQASTYWTEFGARRGYAALCIDFPIPGYRSSGGYPINSGVELGDDPRQAPIYHGAVALLRAVSFLESRAEVDRERIGMAGSSWGGFYTTLMAGVDPRLKAASCMFGCGSLELGNNWWDSQGRDPKRDDAFRKRWAQSLDPALRLSKSKTPIAWFTGTNDTFYWLPSVMDSHAKAAGPRHLTLLANYNHALTPSIDDQVFAWLDVHLKGAPAFLTLKPVAISKDHKATWRFAGPRKAVSARMLVSYGEPGNWVSRHWLEIPAKITEQTCTAKLPAASLPGVVIGTVIDDKGYAYATPMIRFEATDKTAAPTPAYDGCSMWNKFDADQQFLKLHGLPTLPVADGLATITKTKATLGPILFTAGVPHVFRARIVAKEAALVTVTLHGAFDGKTRTVEKTFALKAAANEIEMEFTPPVALSASLRALVTPPEKGTVQLGNARFEPLRHEKSKRESP